MSQVLVILGLIGFIIALVALFRGHLDWARIKNRKIATAGLVVAFGIMLTGGALADPATNTANTASQSASSATTSSTAPTTTTTIAPTTTTTIPPTTTTTTNPPPAATTEPAATHQPVAAAPPPPATHPTTEAYAPPPPPASALACSASMSDGNPADYSTTDVLVQTGVSGASVTATAHYKTTSTTHQAPAGGDGSADIPFRISDATPGYTVEVDVYVTAGNQSQSCSTSFTPYKA